MSEDAVVNWDAIVHKNVRSKDGQDAGNVDAIEGNTVVITSEGDRQEYNLPKSQVAGYDGAEVSLKITFGELEKYKVKTKDFQAFFCFIPQTRYIFIYYS
ncbi:MAG TPA: DUF2171 domain-containing protein [Nitrososphaeraceae archaeon]